MELRIPPVPDSLYFTINRLWNGTPCADESLFTEVWVTKQEGGISIRVHAPEREGMKVPDAPRDTRVDGLWDYDVVEVFLAGDDGTYTEVEMGPGGHYLVLAFDGVRHRSDDFAGREFDHRQGTATPGTWQTTMVIPWDALPKRITNMNAFVIAGGQFLAMSPVPGDAPDFHQPSAFPTVSL